MDKILKIVIEDYAMASFCSGSTILFIEKEPLRELAMSHYLDNTKDPFYKVWSEYTGGNKKAKYNVAYQEVQFAKDCTVIQESLNKLCNREYNFDNIWGCAYHLKVDEFWFERAIIKDGKHWHVVIRPAFKGLRITSRTGLPDLYIDHTWGFPHLYKYDEETQILESQAFILEKTFDAGSEEALEMFLNNDLYLERVFREIVGDG